MTTDNRTNEPTDAQARAVRKLDNVQAILAGAQASVTDAVRELSLTSAALVAAQGGAPSVNALAASEERGKKADESSHVAPQAPSNLRYIIAEALRETHSWSESTQAAYDAMLPLFAPPVEVKSTHSGVVRDTEMGGAACPECGWHLWGRWTDSEAQVRSHAEAHPVLPSSGVDEDALMAELDRHNPRHDFKRQVSNCACGWKFKNHVEGAHSVHRARAVAEWLKEKGGESRGE